jgi:hypothetical protein
MGGLANTLHSVSDIRGSKPHNRHPSGAASDLLRGSSPEARRKEPTRILLSVCLSTTTDTAYPGWHDPNAFSLRATQPLTVPGVAYFPRERQWPR